MNIDQLKSFLQVAASGSFTKAARELFLTQPAVSQQIQALESHFGATLFDRSGKKVTLTSEGEILLAHTEKFFQYYEEIEALIDRFKNLKMGKMSLGATAVMGTYFLPGLIGRFNRRYPGIDLDLKMGNSHNVFKMLIEGKVDLGFAGRIKVNPRLTGILIHREKLLIVSAPEHPLAGKKIASPAELDKTPFIWREKGTQTRELVNTWFEKRAGPYYPKKNIELQNLEAAKRTVVEGFGVTVLPEISVKREVHLGLLKPIDLKGFDLSFEYYLFLLKGKTISRAVTAFLEMLSGYRLLSEVDALAGFLPEDS